MQITHIAQNLSQTKNNTGDKEESNDDINETRHGKLVGNLEKCI